MGGCVLSWLYKFGAELHSIQLTEWGGIQWSMVNRYLVCNYKRWLGVVGGLLTALRRAWSSSSLVTINMCCVVVVTVLRGQAEGGFSGTRWILWWQNTRWTKITDTWRSTSRRPLTMRWHMIMRRRGQGKWAAPSHPMSWPRSELQPDQPV